jgi:hypothetical protein
MELPSRETIAFEFSMALMRRAFRDLAVSFAAIDPRRADAAIRDLEKAVVAEFEALLKQPPPDGVTIEEMGATFAEVVIPFRDMTQTARNLIQQAGKPKN